jgi:hypothetical protein
LTAGQTYAIIKTDKAKEVEVMEDFIGLVVTLTVCAPIMLVCVVVKNWWNNKLMWEEQARLRRLYSRRRQAKSLWTMMEEVS